MATKQDYYDILGISRDASDSEIKTAYRKLAHQYHPDKNNDAGSEDRFKEINEAYEVLSNPEKRDAYDRFGHSGDNIFGQGFEGFGFDGVGSIFDAFFGGRTTTSTRQAPERGSDLQCNVSITLEEAAFGVEKELNISRIEFCSQCPDLPCQILEEWGRAYEHHADAVRRLVEMKETGIEKWLSEHGYS